VKKKQSAIVLCAALLCILATRSAAAQTPVPAETHFKRGVEYAVADDYDNAIAEYTQAIKLNPNISRVYHNRGNAYERKHDYYNAIADYTQSIKLDPNISAYKDSLAKAQKAQAGN
jgi:tetratricopeptide (TPR) repeat protein